MISLIFISIGIFIYLHLSRFTQFCIITVVTFLPFTLGDIGSIENFLVVRWLAPVFFLISLNDVFATNIMKRTHPFSLRGAELFVFAIMILLVWAVYSYIRNPVLGKTLGGGDEIRGGLSLYYGLFINILLFFSIILFLLANLEKIDFNKWLNVLIIFSLATGIIRVATYFLGISTPLLAGAFNYGGVYSQYGSTAYRIGGLTEVAWLGLSAILAKSYLTNKLNFSFLIIFLFFMIISGGRTILIGISIALMLYTLFFNKSLLKYSAILAVGLVVFSILFVPKEYFVGQIERITNFEGGIQKQDPSRTQYYVKSIENFKNNPVFGKGIALSNDFIYNNNKKVSEFVREQLFSGGHGSYISLLSTFGAGGLLYFLIMVFGGIIVSFKTAREQISSDNDFIIIPIFTLIFLIITSVYSITSNNGFSDPTMFFSVALLASNKIFLNQNKISESYGYNLLRRA